MTITAARRDYNGPIEVTIAGLPDGVATGPVYVGAGINSVTTTVTGPKAAPAAPSLSEIIVTGRATIQDVPFEAKASLVDTLRARWSGVTQVSPRFANPIALAIAPAQGISLRLEPAEVVFGKNLKATVKVIAERSAGFDQPIKLVTSPEKDGVPANVAVELKPIEKDKNEVVLTLSANEKAATGPFSIALAGVHEKDKVTTTAVAPNLTLKLQEAFQLAATPQSSPMLARGSQLKFKVNVTRNPAYAGEVKLVCEKLPAGVLAPEALLKTDQNEVELVLSATAEAAVTNATDVVLRASSPAEAKISSTIPLPAFSVQ